uniref:Rad50/SbcC-type AAA domain-containing protein n=1 Tax=Odontella aurita TaxID=265563 RepID=A0A7S4K6V4_9STRA|mmetsp:Transcript_63093/g.186412  ORF Transcript_63093/g.186412 Transcript_63093/m.186412 type:complete len:840 (+) Transcript_63093:538-3057(+)
MLRHQLSQDAENVDETLREQSFLLQKHDLQPNARGFGSDADGVDRIVEEMKTLVDKVRDKHADRSHELSRIEEEVQSAQRGASEKGALVDHNRRLLNGRKGRAEALNADDGSVKRIKKIIRAVGAFEDGMGMIPNEDDVPLSQDMDPQDLLKYLSTRSKEFGTSITPDVVRAVLKKLKKMSRKRDEDGQVCGLICPCCQRGMEEAEIEVFANSMKDLSDPETSEIILTCQQDAVKDSAAKTNYERWHTNIQNSMTDYLEYKRAVDEIETMERTVADGQGSLDRFKSDLAIATERASELREETSELRTVLDVAARLRDESERMFDKKTQISTKEEELAIAAPSSNGRDLDAVEREIQARNDEKDSLQQSITRLNRELTSINDRISRVTTQAAKAESMAREKEKRYKQEQEAAVKRTELNEVIVKCQQEEKKLAEQIVPIKQKIRAKESDRQRMRSSAKSEEDRLNESLNRFKADVHKLDDLSDKIDRYIESNKHRQFEEVTRELSEAADRQDEREKELEAMKPELAGLNKKVNDQERHKKTIQGNIELLGLMKGIETKRKELDMLEEEIDAVQGSDTTARDYEAAGLRIQKHENAKAQCEGRRAGKKDQIRSLKRKLQTPEYKDVDERHRRKMIEFETTLIAVKDLEKYHTALDKALLRYHGMKIQDINKIVRELWTLTYKGEDITNIKLMSDQDKGSKAAKSHNYRVVMMKGTTELDMRGRCSAGQRVLASIVIRLALAETFCLNCGVLCLDEPTTNLDYANKRGLAIALAQIIATRASQTNFQLVVITHDEEFVTMMKNELSAHTGFTMPDRYFQVSREEGSDGKHYSKIHAIDWDEL